MRGKLGCILAVGFGAVLVPWAHAEGIYMCVDAKGRRLTSDRPIMECLDREQTQLNSSGQVIRKIGPSLTADERAAEEEKAKRAAEERNRLLDEKKRDRVLLARYPDKATHDKERNAAIASVDEVTRTASRRIDELRADRRKIDADLEFFKGDLAKAPPQLKRRLDENDQLVAAQLRFIANQEEEKKRINARYDKEFERLKDLWAATAPNRSSSSAAR
jgi:chromosome segregation ATPase